MTLQKREKILAWAAGVLLAVVAVQFVYSSLGSPRGNLKAQRAALVAEVQKKKNRLLSARRAPEILQRRRERSLPAAPEIAQSRYEMWLRQLATTARLSDAKISYRSRQHVGDVYYALRFSLRAKGTIADLTEFLHGFYSAGYLHQIIGLTITPNDNGAMLDVNMTVDALSLAGAAAKDKLPPADPQRALAKLDVYREKIAGRNIFAPFAPVVPQMRTAAPPETVDPLKFTELNGIVSVGNRQQVWINAKLTDDHYELFEGEEVEISTVKCKVLRIGQRDAEIEIDGKRYLVSYGKSLRDGTPLASDAPATK